MDKREQILQRLLAVATGIAGVKTAVRNQDELSEHKRPAIALFDADETIDDGTDRQDHAGRGPALIYMTPEVLILRGAAPQVVGTSLNSLRASLIKGVLTDVQLATLVGPNGRVRYAGCSTHLGHGRSMEGSMSVHFSFEYVLRPESL